MTDYVYTLSTTEFEEALTQAKNVYLNYLRKEGHISEEVFKDLALNTGILIRKPNFFCEAWGRYFKKGGNATTHYIVVEQKSIEEDLEEETNGGRDETQYGEE